MSVSNPVDSGGLRAFDHDLQGLAEQMNTVGGWAEIMAADSMNNTVEDEEPTREVDIDQQPAGRITNKKGRDPPYMAQILGWQKLLDIEEFYLFLGGSDKVVTIDNGSINKNRLIVTMRTREDLEELVVKKQIEFKGKPLRVFFENPSPQSDCRQDAYYSQRDSYSRQSSNYGSTTSLTSSHHGGYSRNRNDHGPPNNQYQTLPSRGFRDDRGPRGSYNGRKNSRGDRYDGGYDSRRYGNDLIRSESYSQDRDRPGPIYRSRTDDGLDGRRSEFSSRANSQMSINQDPVRKPSAKDIFGEAKPVDVSKRLAEMEEREKQKKETEKQRYQQHRMAQNQMTYIPNTQYSSPPPIYPYGFVTPIVPLSGPHFPMQTPPGSVRIQQRDISEEAADMSPPLDPKHPTPSVPETIEHPIETINEEPSPVVPRRDSNTQDSKTVIPRSGGQAPPAQKFVKPRTFHRSGPENRGKGQHRARGENVGTASPIDLTVEGNSEKNNNKEGATGRSSDNRLSKDKKEMDGSHASLGSKRGGGFRGGRGGYKNHPPRERRPSREDHHKSFQGKEKNQSQRKVSRDEDQKPQTAVAQTTSKPEAKKEIAKQEVPSSTPKVEAAPATVPLDAKEKKKEKKKKANAAKNNTPLGSNKFALLSDALD